MSALHVASERQARFTTDIKNPFLGTLDAHYCPG